MHPETLPAVPVVAPYLPPGHDPFAEAAKAPGPVLWTRVYAGVLVVLNLASLAYLAFFGTLWSAFSRPSASSPSPPGAAWPSFAFESLFLGVLVVFGLFALAHAALCAYLAVCPRKPPTHTLGTVTLALSLFSMGGCLPLSILFLVFWLKPEVKAWFEAGRPTSSNAA